MNAATTTHDVLVVGAGPAGLTTGIALARHGVDVLVVDRHAGTSPFPKATGISTRTMELMRTLMRPEGFLGWRCSDTATDARAELRRAVDLVLGRTAPALAQAA